MVRLKAFRVKQLLVVLLITSLLSGTAYLLGWSSILTVNSVVVEGTTSRTEIMRKLESDSIKISVGTKLARVEPRAVARSIQRLDWIDQVEVSRDWLGKKIKITIVEKTAVAKSISNNDGLVNFDSTGAIFKPVSASQLSIQQKLPLVIVAENNKSLLVSVSTLLSQLSTQNLDLLVNLKSISVSSSGLIQMQTLVKSQSLQINWGLARDISQKVEVLNALLNLPENKEIKRVDLSQPKLPIVS